MHVKNIQFIKLFLKQHRISLKPNLQYVFTLPFFDIQLEYNKINIYRSISD